MPISPFAQIDPAARLGDNVDVGPFSVIGENASIGQGCRIGNHVVIHPDTIIEACVRIDDHAVIGKQPMRASRSATTTSGAVLPPARIGSESLVGTGAVLYAGCTIGQHTLVADYATVRERVVVGAETIVGRGVAIENDCLIGARCKLETNAYLCAFTTVGDDVFIAPGVLTSNDNFMGRTEERKQHYGGPTLENGSRLGVGAIVLPGKTVAAEAVLAAGAVLTRDAESGKIHQGVPAKTTGDVPSEQLLENSDP